MKVEGTERGCFLGEIIGPLYTGVLYNIATGKVVVYMVCKCVAMVNTSQVTLRYTVQVLNECNSKYGPLQHTPYTTQVCTVKYDLTQDCSIY